MLFKLDVGDIDIEQQAVEALRKMPQPDSIVCPPLSDTEVGMLERTRSKTVGVSMLEHVAGGCQGCSRQFFNRYLMIVDEVGPMCQNCLYNLAQLVMAHGRVSDAATFQSGE